MSFDEDDYRVEPPRQRRFFTQTRPNGEPVEGEADYVPNADDFIPSPPKPRGPLSKAPDLRYARPAFLMWALFFAASFVHWKDPEHSPFAATAGAVLQGGEWWRLFTALFTHADMDHLASNTPLFLIFGWFLSAYFGSLVFPVASLVVGALSNLATIYTYDSPDASLVGASGMLYGMVALWLVLYVKFDTDRNVPVRIFRAIGVSLLLLFPTTFHPTTSYTAHAAGFFIGLAVGVPLSAFVRVRNSEATPVT